MYIMQLRKNYCVPLSISGSMFISSLEIGGIIGSLTAGVLADKLVSHVSIL